MSLDDEFETWIGLCCSLMIFGKNASRRVMSFRMLLVQDHIAKLFFHLKQISSIAQSKWCCSQWYRAAVRMILGEDSVKLSWLWILTVFAILLTNQAKVHYVAVFNAVYVVIMKALKLGLNRIQTLTPGMPVQCSTSWATSPTVSWLLCWWIISPQMIPTSSQLLW